MAGQATVYYVTYVDPASGGNPSSGAPRPPPPPYSGQQVQPVAPPYPGPNVYRDQGRPPTAPPYDTGVPNVHQDHRPGPPPRPPPVPNGQQHHPQQHQQTQPQQQHWHQLQQQQWQQRGYVPPAFPGVNGNDDAVGSRRVSNKTGANVTVVAKENRRGKWAMFVLGNLISIAVVVSEISQLSVCFEENLTDDDDLPEDNASYAYIYMMFALVLGAWVDIFSAVTLSVIYGSPLDIKSVHKIPAGDMRHCGGTIMINFLAPFSWSLIYLSGGLVSINYGQNAPCGGGAGGEGLEQYLYVSAALMFLFSFAMFFLSGVMLLLACVSCPQRRSGPGPTRPAGCCTRIRETLYRKVLSKSPIYDLGWQLQGVVLSYRSGAFGLVTAILVGAAGVFGEVLAAFGSLAPVAVEELLGPVMM